MILDANVTDKTLQRKNEQSKEESQRKLRTPDTSKTKTSEDDYADMTSPSALDANVELTPPRCPIPKSGS